jgi:hypothetical protein
LKEILLIPGQCGQPIYLIIDGLDESPNSSGFPSPHEGVLNLLKELVGLCLTNLCICVTSCPEMDIQHAVKPLASHKITLHDQTGQKKDIVEYIRSIVYSDSEHVMKGWKMDDKEDIIKKLSDGADGM